MNNVKVREGLGLLFWGNIIGLFSWLPLLGGFVALAAVAMEVYGIWKLRVEEQNYNAALGMLILGFAASFLAIFGGFFGSVMGWVQTLLACAATYLICTGTGNCVRPYSAEAAEKCIRVRSWYVLCMLISLAIDIVSVIPILGILAIPAAIVVAVMQIIASIRYLMMLWRCKNLL